MTAAVLLGEFVADDTGDEPVLIRTTVHIDADESRWNPARSGLAAVHAVIGEMFDPRRGTR